MNKPLRIYLAGGMKSNWQDTVMNVCPMHEYIDPRTHGLTTEDEYTKWDLDGVRGSDLVFAYMDTANPSGFGMSLEVGFAKALGIPVWYVCEDASERQKYFGMVRACADRKFSCLAEAVAELMDIGALTMPYELAMADELSRMQFWSRVQLVLKRLEATKPLSDAEIGHLWEINVGEPTQKYPFTQKDWINFARAVERAVLGRGGEK